MIDLTHPDKWWPRLSEPPGEPLNPEAEAVRNALEKVVEALKPFATVADDPHLADHPDSYTPRPSRGRPNMADYRRAKAVLALIPAQDSKQPEPDND